MRHRTDKPIVLLAFANDLEGAQYLRNLPAEARRLQEVLRPAEKAGLCEVILRQNVTLNQLLDIFQDAEYRDRISIFHFGGHAEEWGLLLQMASGEGHWTYADGLAAFLA